jgi:hypothetical protein
MILYHSESEISTLRWASRKDKRARSFDSALCLSAFVVNMFRTNKKLSAEEPNATRKINSIDLCLRLHTAA